jgi:hypothetical protein
MPLPQICTRSPTRKWPRLNKSTTSMPMTRCTTAGSRPVPPLCRQGGSNGRCPCRAGAAGC